MDLRVFFAPLAIVFAFCRACSNLEPNARLVNSSESDENKVYYSEIVVFGKVGQTVTGDYPFSNISGISAISFDIYCTFKGATHINSLNKIIIAGLGNQNKQIVGCPNATVETDKEVIMFIKSTGQKGVFELEFAPVKGQADVILDDLSTVCGLEQDTDSTHTCGDYETSNDKDCSQFVPRPIINEVDTHIADSSKQFKHNVTSKDTPLVTQNAVNNDKMVNEGVATSKTSRMSTTTNKMSTQLATTQKPLARDMATKKATTSLMTKHAPVETNIGNDKMVNDEVARSKTIADNDASQDNSCSISTISLLLVCCAALLVQL